MSKRNLPGFTADLSLRQSSGHYRNGRSISATGMTHAIPQAAKVTEENGVITIIDDAPLQMPWGWGPGGWTTGGGGGVPTGGGSGEGGGSGSGGGGGSSPPKDPPPKPPQGQNKKDERCELKGKNGSTYGKCQIVCKDKNVTKDRVNNRWVCAA